MKIFFVTRGLHNHGGIERVTSVVANELSARGYHVGIVCLQKGKPYFPLNKSVELLYVEGSRLMRLCNLKGLYKKQSPDVVVFLGSHRLLTNIPAAKGFRNITWEHFNTNINWHPFHKISRWLGAKYSNRIVTLTQRDADNYKKLFNAQNAICIPNPITINGVVPSDRRQKIVLAVGRLASQKGFDMLIDAWAKVDGRKDGWRLRIVGSGSHRKRLLVQIAQNGLADSVEIIPATPNISELYQSSALMVMSSRYEGLPLVLIEAMAYGLPIVSFDCDTGPSQIIEHNKTGLLVEPNNIDLLASSLDKMMSDKGLQTQCAANALQSVERFSTKNIIDQWEQLFVELSQESPHFM